LRRAGLTAEIEPATGTPANRVIAQQPAAGTEVTRRSAVVLRVTDGTQPVAPPESKGATAEYPVPNVVGLAYDEAIARLARFRAERSHRAGVEPGGQVIAQNPPSGTMRPSGSAVAIVLSDGTLTVVPDLLGFSFDRAIQRLQQTALRWQRIDSTSDQAVGQVIGQAPVAGDRIARGSVVRVQVSSGPAPLELPDVVGLRVDDAIARLAPFAVTRAETAANAPRGEVVAQRPAAGTRLVRGGAVELTVSSGQEAIEVPDVIDEDVAAARARLGEFRVTTMAVPGRPPRERVVAQAPPAGSMQSAGGAVTLSVSDGSLAEPLRTDPTPAAVTSTSPSLRWWLLAGGFGAVMLGAGVVVGRLGAPKPVPRVHAAATLALAPADARIDGAAVVQPTLQLQATLEFGAARVEPPEPPLEAP
jgi:beta-lactam-binding protein with PASTA domain